VETVNESVVKSEEQIGRRNHLGKGGLKEFPVPILKGNVEMIKSIRKKLYEPEFSDLTVVDFSDLAQGCKTYDEFIEKMNGAAEIKNIQLLK